MSVQCDSRPGKIQAWKIIPGLENIFQAWEIVCKPGNIIKARKIFPGLENISRLAKYFQAWKMSNPGLENISRPGIPPRLGKTQILTLGVQPSRSSVPSMSPRLRRFVTFVHGSTEGPAILAKFIRPIEFNSRDLPRLCATVPCASEFATPVNESSLCNCHTHSDHG